jgi:hypothetical protein
MKKQQREILEGVERHAAEAVLAKLHLSEFYQRLVPRRVSRNQSKERLMLAAVVTDIHARWREKGSTLMHGATCGDRCESTPTCGEVNALLWQARSRYHSNIEGSRWLAYLLASKDTSVMNGRRTIIIRGRL